MGVALSCKKGSYKKKKKKAGGRLFGTYKSTVEPRYNELCFWGPAKLK